MKAEFLKPHYWPIWIAYFLLRLVTLLPTRQALWVGRVLGRIFHAFAKKRRAIAKVNLDICFPQLSDAEKEDLIRRQFESLGMSLISMGIGWWKNEDEIKRLVKLEGKEIIDQAMREWRGVILLSAHFNSLEISARLFASQISYRIFAVYQANSNPLLDYLIQKNRAPILSGLISHRDIRQMIYKLRENAIVWYAPDQGYKGKYSALVPFFGEPSASNTATSKLAKLSKAKVIPFFVFQNPDYTGFTLKLLPPLENYPSNDPVADTLRYHQLLEEVIKQAPEQYLWIHRRFKGRPAEYPDPYANIRLRK